MKVLTDSTKYFNNYSFEPCFSPHTHDVAGGNGLLLFRLKDLFIFKLINFDVRLFFAFMRNAMDFYEILMRTRYSRI